MKWAIDFDTYEGVVAVTAKGPMTVDDFGQYVAAGLVDERFQKGMPILLDFRDQDCSQLSREDLESMAAILESRSQAVGRVRAAVVVSTPRDYALIKIWEVFAGHLFAAHDVFYSVDDALAFLRQASGGQTGGPCEAPL